MRVRALGALVAACVVAWAALGSAFGASSTVTVTASVPSAVSITNDCTSDAATKLGVVLPGQSATTSTATGACRFGFQGTSDTAMLRIAQRDGQGAAMGTANLPWTAQYQGGFRANAAAIDATGTQYAKTLDGWTVRSTIDSGATWTDQSIATATLHDIAVDQAVPNRWWAVGDNGQVYTTANGLAASPTWTGTGTAPMTTLAAAGWPNTVRINAVTTAGGSTWLVGENRWIARTTNNGTNWTAYQHSDTSFSSFHTVSAANATTVMLAGHTPWADSVLLSTTGGGSSAAWTFSTNSQSGYYVHEVSMASPTRAYLAHRGGVMSWNGTAWSEGAWATGHGQDSMLGVDSPAANGDVAYAVGERGVLYKTTNNGATWTLETSSVGNTLMAVAAPTATAAWSSGSGMAIIATTDGASWQQRSIGPGHEALLSVTSDPVDGKIAVAVGSRGLMKRTVNGGAAWTTLASGTTRTLRSVDMGTSRVGWAVGDLGTILVTRDGGATWSMQTVGTAMLNEVAAVDDLTAYAVGSGGTMLRTTDGGVTWTSVPTGTTGTLRGLDATPTRVWIGGEYGFVRHSADGGATWVTPTGVPSPWFAVNAIVVTSTTVWLSTPDNFLYRSTNVGATWTQLGHDLWQGRAFGVAGTGLMVAGPEGKLARTTDEFSTRTEWGITWPELITDLEVLGMDDAYATDDMGGIWRTSPATAPAATVSDYVNGPSDWDSGGASSMFGVCVQAVGAGTTPVWTVDAANLAGRCQMLDTDPWNAIPVAATKIARTTIAGGAGSVDLVWGYRARANQTAATYSATVVLEALAPDV